MGASSSKEQTISSEQREVETLAASTGALPMLQKSFSKLADPQSNTIPLQSLKQCFSLNYKDPIFEVPAIHDNFMGVLDHLGSSLVDLFFVPEKGGVSWVEFVKAYVKCCGRISASTSLNTLLRLFHMTMDKAGFSSKLEFESDDADCKISGSLLPIDVLMLLCMCWTMQWNFRSLKFFKRQEKLCLPDFSHLVLSSVISCDEVGSGFNVWKCDISSLDFNLPVGKFLTWTMKTVPSIVDCFTEFFHAKLQISGTLEDKLVPSSSSSCYTSETKACDTVLLTLGRAWAISLTLKGVVSEEILKTCFPCEDDGTDENLLYRSSLQGRGLNRFWSNVEGYHGPLLFLISAISQDHHEESTNARKWIIGALMQQGFENKDLFYGNSGNLYTLNPVFNVFSPSGKEKNFVYSHSHPTGRVYEPHPKPVGIAFGGTIGNERIFIDDDFATVTVRHHAIDKTYQPGSLIPYQGYLPVEAMISEVEVWGLGGRTANKVQASYKKREELFTEQRRKVDLKTFASWEDSPEKMMMDMVSNPDRVQREDR
ncbi:TLD domain-containing protein [Cephalotus follicularis]|uniref:TLD domain-containing protein n=1 Tax=Cephalotus follicularis TaxID=3775 RepID=A0A1Q3C7M7_CEPFO|nr:TLD domain-containing protein [Cephalotus follicularis]